jgi:hypothetical protein
MATRTRRADAHLRVLLEEGTRRTFAMAADWPGWGRAARDADAALRALVEYRNRYAVVASAAGLNLPAHPAPEDLPDPDAESATSPADLSSIEIVARFPGNATTDFGAPGLPAPDDDTSWPADVRERQLALLRAAWTRFDDVVANAPAALRKGPRGGGRDRDAIVDHVLGTEPAYARKAGLTSKPGPDRAGLDEHRAELLVLLAESAGPAPTAKGWPALYAVRRIAWHALDHAWEIEDRSEP